MFGRALHWTSSRQPVTGFALVATLMLLILLLILAVSLMSLSGVALRTAGHDASLAEARANARMALMIAIGELQKHAGPDRAITATSEIFSAPGAPVRKANTTGVWQSWWDFDPSVAPDYTSEKPKRFIRWLVSGDQDASFLPDYVRQPWTGRTVELVGDRTLGCAASTEEKVIAGVIKVMEKEQVRGGYAWHVADESVKARINLYRDPSQNETLAQKRALLAGHRPDPSILAARDGSALNGLPSDLTPAEFAKAEATTGKVLDLDQAELFEGARGKFKSLRHHITTHSLGVMTDVRGGGLKQDLSSMFEMGNASTNTLPAEFTGKTLYQSTHGITGVSDPNWSALAGYYNSFRNLTHAETSPTYVPRAGSISTQAVPDGFSPAPVITKVDTIFSIVARPLINQAAWIYANNANMKGYMDYGVGLITSPVVTLHNPYNVNISFYKMEVSFNNLPVAFNLMFSNNGAAYASQSTVPNQFEAMNTYAYNSNAYGKPVRNDRNFVMTIADWTDDNPLVTPTGAPGSSGIKGPIVMKPGQTLICGIALRANASYDQDTKSASNVAAMDWENTLYSKMKGKPAYTPGIGFETLSIAPGHLRGPSAPNKTTNMFPSLTTGNSNLYPGAWSGQIFMLLRDHNTPAAWSPNSVNLTDRFYIEYKVQRPEWFTDDLRINATATASYTATGNMKCAPATFGVSARLQATAADSLTPYANLQFNYGDQSYQTYSVAQRAAFSGPAANVKTANDHLDKFFGNRVYRYPPTGYLVGSDFAAPPAVLYSQQAAYVHPFAIFSAYARTTSGGVYENGSRTAQPNPGNSSQINLLKDGRLTGKPFLFHHASRANFVMDLATEKPSTHAYELNFQPFLSKGDYQDYMDVDSLNRVPSLTGNKTTSGVKSGSYLEIPSGPLQAISDFRKSNALNTSYAPSFVQPVGNSWVHPLMSTSLVIESDPTITSNPMLDHSVLSNHALYDRFYFSTFATRGNIRPDLVFEQFMSGSAPLATQRFQPYLTAGKTVADAKAELYSGETPSDSAYRKAAEYQMIRGPFNVNSTSVPAWKAVIASMNQTDVAVLWAKNAVLETKGTTGIPVTGMSMPNGGSLTHPSTDSSKIDNTRTNCWNGFRELTDTQLESLARSIVDEVRERGPFLCMSEFVNRRIGPSSDPRTHCGALEAAIIKSEINEPLAATSADSFMNQVPIIPTDYQHPALYNYKTPEIHVGTPAAGAPGWISQGDLLRILEPSATVRGDTFVIRTYGEALDEQGRVTAKAHAEAVVQRVPDHVDPTDRASVNAATEPSANPVNKRFGRRFQLVAFRWLSENEI
jgi:hypothetical protein